MRKRNKVAQLNKTSSHRKAMLSNIVTSLLYHERIQSTTAKAKAAGQLAERLITRAKKNTAAEVTEAQKIHNIRMAAKVVKDKEVLNKLFNDIALRNTERKGGYTRVIKIGKRVSDASEMAMVELVERKELAQLKDERKDKRAEMKKGSKKKKVEKSEDDDKKKKKK